MNARVISKVAERLKTYDLRKFEDLKEIPEMLGFDGDYPAGYPKGKKVRRSSCTTFHRKFYFN